MRSLSSLDEIKNWTFGLGDLFGEPIVKTADSLFAGFNFIGGGGAVSVGPLVAKWGSSTDIDERIVLAVRSRYSDLLPQRFRVPVLRIV